MIGPTVLTMCLLAPVTIAEPPTKEEHDRAARIEMIRLQGTWELESWEQDGKQLPAEKLKERQLTIGGPVFIWRDGGELLQFGTLLSLNATKEPKILNAKVVAGEHRGEQMLGIYELANNKLKICFDVEGVNRPETFDTADTTGRYSVVCRRMKVPPEEKPVLGGKYKSVSEPVGSPKLVGTAEIHRLGESYLVRYSQLGKLTYVGIGVRSGDVLSVCWSTPDKKAIGLSVYQIAADGKMTGRFTGLGGPGVLSAESLTPEPVIE